MVELEVLGVRRQAPADQVVVLLIDLVGRRLLPIVVGVNEGSAIVAGQSGVAPPRPMTHDLLVSALSTAGVQVEQVEIVSLLDGVFHAALLLDNGKRVDSRASDAIALAVRVGCPVLCAPAVLDESALVVEEHTPEDEVEEFRAFLDTVSADDFVAGDAGDEGDDGPRGGS
jgi:bifunctional DNase/RNase